MRSKDESGGMNVPLVPARREEEARSLEVCTISKDRPGDWCSICLSEAIVNHFRSVSLLLGLLLSVADFFLFGLA
jgi:hypothetical protein